MTNPLTKKIFQPLFLLPGFLHLTSESQLLSDYSVVIDNDKIIDLLPQE